MTENDNIKDDLDNILRKVADKLNINHYELNADVSTDRGEGFVSVFCTGEIKNKDNGDTVAVAIKKSPPYEGFNYGKLFKNEELFYVNVFPKMGLFQHESGIKEPFENIPTFYSSEMSPNNHIALENLKQAGYKMYDKMLYLNEEHLEYIFKVYGRFHAISFVIKHRNLEKYKELTENLSDVFVELDEVLIEGMRKAMVGAFKALDEKNDKEAYKKTKVILEDWKEFYKKGCCYTGKYSCITHGDCWSNNMMFKYSDSGKLENLKLIDFQLIRDSTPVHDLSYFFYSGASKKDFDNIEHYLKLYHQSFSEMCTEFHEDPYKIFPLEALKHDWKENAFLGVLLGIYLWQSKLLPKEKIKKILENGMNEEDKRKAWSDLNEQTYASEEYRERTRAILIHATEYCVI